MLGASLVCHALSVGFLFHPILSCLETVGRCGALPRLIMGFLSVLEAWGHSTPYLL